MRVVHVQTTIETVFGVVDDDGNVIPQQPVVARASVFSADTFADAFDRIAAEREKALAEADRPFADAYGRIAEREKRDASAIEEDLNRE